ncbi:adenine phosphoribosyltransferase [Arenibacter sp. GZD96]|uniref:adenine phosphoribosyltransferase n=1 Tax=Aurantibrevibacter litoralis TaxID=3106030 RepID=UPI002AFF0DFE|nr:adenine phosphoribosyltransferase [Arenibacter sp. GZD-96]MEA1787013.1 adenine phosphoribosyltransferase [Arenibacter sp. GZD-96]
MEFKNFIRDINDFPKEGIVFKDITPLLKDATVFKKTALALQDLITERVDKVVGIESRGFIFAPILAMYLDAGFIPVRKKGKLPAKVVSQSYALEYGADRIEIHSDSIQKGDRVLVHDDVLATGGTAHAVCELVEKLGGHIVQCNFLIELHALNGRKNLEKYSIKALVKY